jgi:two-component system LytT family sensor kinase
MVLFMGINVRYQAIKKCFSSNGLIFICTMNKFTRAIFQLVLWFLVLIILGLNQEDTIRFLQENLIAYLFQAILIICLIYILAPKFLFKKKYVQFVVFSILIIFIGAFVSSLMAKGHHGIGMPPPPDFIKMNQPGPFFINLLLISVSYVFATFLETFSFAQKKEEDLILSKSETIENELKFLKSQINPHFLFNSLNNIYALSMIDAGKAQESILYLSDMLRYVLYDCEKSVVAIEKEVTYIEDFIQLFVLKSSKKFPITTSFNIEDPKLKIAPMLLIPFVENAFKHSNIQNIAESFINISIHSKADSVIFEIENSFKNGPVSKDGVGGIGIRNVRKRLSLLYPDSHMLEIIENNDTFKVKLKMNVDV